jgi:hypothetical protein
MIINEDKMNGCRREGMSYAVLRFVYICLPNVLSNNYR